MEEFMLKLDRLLPPEDTNEYFIPYQDFPRRVVALESAIRRKQYEKNVLIDRAECLDGFPSDETGALLKMVTHSAFGQFEHLVQVTMAKSIATFSTLESVCNAKTDASLYRMATIDSVFVIDRRQMGMSNRAIAIELAVGLGLPLSHDGAMPLTPPLSPYSHEIGMGSDDGVVSPYSATGEELIDLVKHYMNALLLLDTNWADLVALVHASAELCRKQADRCQDRVDKLKQDQADAQAQVDAL
ncbi:hypothetical protein GGF32_002682 [Allomyces javanicus]|nr:hypothetical protein GGF32_002682 [Allomyces javanicus]